MRALPPGEGGRAVDYSDPTRRGLRLRVSKVGTKTVRRFLVAYRRPSDGRAQKMSLGQVGEMVVHGGRTVPLSLAVAGQMVEDIRAKVRTGIDPAQERANRREAAKSEEKALLFSHACDAFEAEELPALRPATRAGWSRFITAEIKPTLGLMKPEDITPNDLAEMRSGIERGIPGPKAKDGSRTWKRKPAPVSARRCYEVVRRIFGWLSTADPEVEHARRRYGIARLEVNPADAARTFRRNRRVGKTRAEGAAKAYTDEQLRAVFAAAAAEVETAEAEIRSWAERHPEGDLKASLAFVHASEARSFENLVGLLAHTAVRVHDARAALWASIDQTNRKLWSITRHKTSDHTGAPHVVPLSSGAIAVLARCREANLNAGFGKSAWVFPADTSSCEVCGKAGAGHMDKDQKAAKRVKAAAGILGRGLLHRLRDTIKTRMSEHGIDSRVSEAILAHVPPGIVGTYDHTELLPQRREALAWWSDELARILSGTSRTGEARKRRVRR